jgi:hypothetical protein
MTSNMNTNSTEKLSRAESSRINGAKSNGPRTSEGKERSSRNRTTHGMRSSRVVLHNESQDTYNQLTDRFFGLFSPNDIFEHSLVTNMVNARWFIRRLQAATTANLDLAMEESRPKFEEKYDNINATHEHALAYRAIAQSTGNTDIMGRHEDRQHRIFERSYRLLAKHRGKQAVLPANEDLLNAEIDLPEDNLPVGRPSRPVHNSLDPDLDFEYEALEPETPPKVAVRPDQPPKSKKKQEPEEPRHPLCVYEDDAEALKPLCDFLEEYPELQQVIMKTISDNPQLWKKAA